MQIPCFLLRIKSEERQISVASGFLQNISQIKSEPFKFLGKPIPVRWWLIFCRFHHRQNTEKVSLEPDTDHGTVGDMACLDC